MHAFTGTFYLHLNRHEIKANTGRTAACTLKNVQKGKPNPPQMSTAIFLDGGVRFGTPAQQDMIQKYGAIEAREFSYKLYIKFSLRALSQLSLSSFFCLYQCCHVWLQLKALSHSKR